MAEEEIPLERALSAVRSVENALKSFARVGEVIRGALKAEQAVQQSQLHLAQLANETQTAVDARDAASSAAERTRVEMASLIKLMKEETSDRVAVLKEISRHPVAEIERETAHAAETFRGRVRLLEEEVRTLTVARDETQAALDKMKKELGEIRTATGRLIGP